MSHSILSGTKAPPERPRVGHEKKRDGFRVGHEKKVMSLGSDTILKVMS